VEHHHSTISGWWSKFTQKISLCITVYVQCTPNWCYKGVFYWYTYIIFTSSLVYNDLHHNHNHHNHHHHHHHIDIIIGLCKHVYCYIISWTVLLGMHIHCPFPQVEIMGGRDVDAFAEIEVAGQKESADIAWGGASPRGLGFHRAW